jgi:CheY-like chemotaxis protein
MVEGRGTIAKRMTRPLVRNRIAGLAGREVPHVETASSAPGVIAVLNDDDAVAAVMRDVLEGECGYRVLVCTRGEDCYRFVKEHRPDLALLDITFGGERLGWSVLQQVRQDPETAQIPIVVCTASDSRLDDHRDQLERYQVPSVPMPFEIDEFLATVQSAFGGRRGRSDPSRGAPA